MVGVLLAAAGLRLAGLDRWPPGLHFDEAVYGLQALEILHGARPVFFSSYTGREPLYMYALALVFAGLGALPLALRLTSALIGILTVALAYPLGRALYGRAVGLTAAALLAVSYWHLTVSRNGYPNILIPPLEALSVYGLWQGWQGDRPRDWLLGGAAAGLVLYTYLAARFWMVFLALFLVYCALVAPRQLAARRRGVLLALAALVLVFLPLGLHFLAHPADFWERANQVLASRQLTGWALLSTYADNAARTFGALAGAGDPRWHYNLPGRAILQPAVAGGFLVGGLLCLRRFRDPRFGLPLIWIFAMAMPGLLTFELQPATQRMFGVFPALTLVAALGLVTTFAWLATRLADRGAGARHRRAIGLAAALAVGSIWALDGLVTARDYFADWARQPETHHIFHNDYVRLAGLARADLAAGRTVVLLSEHYKHPTLAFLAPELVDGAVWADPGSALPEPVARGDQAGETVYYSLDAALPAEAPAARWLAARATAVSVTEVLPFAPDRLDGRRLAVRRQVLPAPGGPAPDGDPLLNGELALVTPLALVQGARGGEVVVPVTLTVAARPAAARRLALHLVDDDGQSWAQSDETGYLAEQWRPGDRIHGWWRLALDRTMPPGRYRARLVLADEAARPLGSAGVDVAQLLVTPGRGRRQPEETAPRHDFGNGLALAEAGPLPEQVQPGSWLPLDLTWFRRGASAPPTRFAVRLRNGGDPVLLGPLDLARDHSPQQWAAGELLHGRYRLPLPADLAPGAYTATLELPDNVADLTLGTLAVAAEQHLFAAPDMAIALDDHFGPHLRLLGADTLPADLRPGQSFTVTLLWQALSATPDPASVFVHLADATGRPLAQHDGVPAGGERPLTGWLPGEYVLDPHRLSLPPDASAGAYHLRVGLYDPVTGARQPVSDPSGRPTGDHVALPGTVRVRP